jgi:cytochrome P450
MSAVTDAASGSTAARADETLEREGHAPPSPAGPVERDTPIAMPPGIPLPRLLQGAGFGLRPLGFNLSNQRRFGDVWQMRLPTRSDAFIVTGHPDHVKSLFTAKPDDAPSATGQSPLRPILGPNSVLTLIGPRHMRERKLLLPPFHGEAVQRYVSMIAEVAEREIDRWKVGVPFALAPRMQAVTLDVIMSGIFGVDGTAARDSLEFELRETLRRFLRMSTRPLWALVELQNMGRREPRGLLRLILRQTDRLLYQVIRERRAAGGGGRNDVLSLLLEARDEDGQPMSDEELRDELVTLVLAGHETTANQLAWTFERLVRFPEAYDRLREAVRSGPRADGDAYVEATIYEGMRARPVIPMIVRLVQRPWRLGSFVVPAHTPVAMSIVGIHHREDLYPDPYAFRPERFLGRKQPDDPGADELDDSGAAQSGQAGGRARGKPEGEAGRRAVRKPGTYTWIPFGGGIRRCLGGALAMAEQQVVLEAIARRADLAATDPAPEAGRQRNVTMIPQHGGRVVVSSKRA